MQGARVVIPYHLISNLKCRLEAKYSNLSINKSKLDSQIFIRKKLIHHLSKFALLKQVNNGYLFDVNSDLNDDTLVTFSDIDYRVYGYTANSEFVYIDKEQNNIVYVFLKFASDLRSVQFIDTICYFSLLDKFELEKSEKNLKIPISKLESRLY